ncbi:Phosphoglycolate phosphatase [compost metagenome]
MLHAAQQIDIAPEHCLYVGDAERDIQAGRAVGMKTVLVNWGYIADSDDTDSWQADITIDQPLALLSHLS